MLRKSLRWALIVVFLAVLAIRLEQHFWSPHSTGVLLEVGNWVPPENCEFHVPLVLHIAADRSLRLNSEPVARDQLSGWLDRILKDRLLPVLYVHVETELTVREFAETLELVRKSNDKIQIRLITPGNRNYSCMDAPSMPAA
jgi:hypothetical protein